MKKILITGATSMIGIALIKEAIKNDVQIIALDISSSPRMDKLPKSDLVQFVDCDLRNIENFDSSSFKDVDCFYHFAWLGTSKEARDNPEIQLLNIRITLDCIKMCSRIGCKKFVGAGSQAEYGYVDGTITPDTPCNPQISYGVAKLAAGKLGRKLCDSLGIVFIWGRVFSVYGPNDNPNTMIRYAIESLLANKTPSFSSGLQKWNYLYEDDVGIVFYLIGCRTNESKVYCIASDDTRELKQFIIELKEVVNKHASVEFTDAISNGIDPDISTLVKDVAWLPTIRFSLGISKIMEEYISKHND